MTSPASRVSDERLSEMAVDWEKEVQLIESHELDASFAIEHSSALRELIALRSQREWVPWKSGDALPSPGRYEVTVWPSFATRSYTERAEVWDDAGYEPAKLANAASWRNRDVIAYWPIALPPPYTPPPADVAREKQDPTHNAGDKS